MLKFNQQVAEIESFYFSNFNPDHFFAAKVLEIKTGEIKIFLPELDKELFLSLRKDAAVDKVFLITLQSDKAFAWTTVADLALKKDGLMPELLIETEELKGKWKSQVEWNDAVLEVDNKSITHRPDMWSHRGFAREIALLCSRQLVSPQSLLKKLPTLWAQPNQTELADPNGRVSISNRIADGCKYFCAARFENIENKPCIPKMAFRLARTGLRPINAIVDLTNYLTGDWGQPVHAYDADRIPNGQLVVRKATKAETLELLDGRTLELDTSDMVITNADAAIALAGIMGGKHDSISTSTKSIIFESANFDATTIRQSAQRHKLRTESSSRFEKSLHKNLALEGVLRFAAVAQTFGVGMDLKGAVICVGKADAPGSLVIEHSFLEHRIGTPLRENDVTKPLEALGFSIEIDHTGDNLCYKIKVPDFRSSKDIKIAEDIVEEVARCYGFEKIVPKIPTFEKQPHDFSSRTKLIAAKNFLAAGAGMLEQYNYNFFNQDFIKSIGFNPGKTLNVQNPVSENTTQLVTSLIPGLLANLVKNYHQAEQLAFFECGKVWEVKTEALHTETAMLAGIFWSKRQAVDFFESKALLTELLKIFELQEHEILWQKLRETTLPWQHPYASAEIEYRKQLVGTAGKINHNVWFNLDFLPTSDAFFFELDLDFLKNYKPELIKAKILEKTQEQSFDLAFITNDTPTAQEFLTALESADKTVKSVVLIDQFIKQGWSDKRSLTFRVKLQSQTDEPISRPEVEKICQKAQETVSAMGAEIRG